NVVRIDDDVVDQTELVDIDRDLGIEHGGERFDDLGPERLGPARIGNERRRVVGGRGRRGVGGIGLNDRNLLHVELTGGSYAVETRASPASAAARNAYHASVAHLTLTGN